MENGITYIIVYAKKTTINTTITNIGKESELLQGGSI